MASKFRFAALTAAAAIAVLAAPLQARTVGVWEVERSTPGTCIMIATFDSGKWEGTSLGLVWTPAEDRLGFVAASKHWNRLLERTGDPAALQLTFDGDVQFSEWLHDGARFQNLGGTETILGSWGAENNAKLAEAVIGSGAVSLRIGETDLGSFAIVGADAAYRELLRCGERS